jgi:hypothetical protein
MIIITTTTTTTTTTTIILVYVLPSSLAIASRTIRPAFFSRLTAEFLCVVGVIQSMFW